MIGRYENKILRLTGMLRHLEQAPDDMSALLDLQRELVRLIKRAEGLTATLKKKSVDAKMDLRRNRHPKPEAVRLKKTIEAYEARIDDQQYLKFIWKCFGDGIAFSYLDKYALKHVFYNTENYAPKQDAGALSGKAGLQVEWRFVRLCAQRQFPAMLCDITNVLRHGDVCGLVGPDPFLVELKSSKSTNERVARQIESLHALGDFLQKDEARNFRGLPYVKRAEFSPAERLQTDALNTCIVQSESKPLAAVSPEPGLHYYCIRDAAALPPMETLTPGSMMCLLNEAKRERSWMPYYPFTLSIRNARHLYEFIRGDFTLAVCVDRQVLIDLFSADGMKLVLTPDSEYVLWLVRSQSGGVSGVSRQLFGRLFYEFQSLAWFVAVQRKYTIENATHLANEVAAKEAGVEPQQSWTGAIPEEVLRVMAELSIDQPNNRMA